MDNFEILFSIVLKRNVGFFFTNVSLIGHSRSLDASFIAKYGKKVIKVVIDVSSVQACSLLDGPAGTGYLRALSSILGQIIHFY